MKPMTITSNSCSVIFACLTLAVGACAQSKTDPPKLEIGAQFSSLTMAPSDFFKYSSGRVFFGPIELHVGRKGQFSTEVGGVVEFYPSRRIVMRFDAGDTMIHYGRLPQPLVTDIGSPSIDTSARVTHNFQLISGVGFRLMGPQQNQIATPQVQRTRRRFEIGGQFTSLTLSIREHYLSLDRLFYYKKSDVGFGSRFGYNITESIAIEAETNFLSVDVNNTFNNA